MQAGILAVPTGEDGTVTIRVYCYLSHELVASVPGNKATSGIAPHGPTLSPAGNQVFDERPLRSESRDIRNDAARPAARRRARNYSFLDRGRVAVLFHRGFDPMLESWSGAALWAYRCGGRRPTDH